MIAWVSPDCRGIRPILGEEPTIGKTASNLPLTPIAHNRSYAHLSTCTDTDGSESDGGSSASPGRRGVGYEIPLSLNPAYLGDGHSAASGNPEYAVPMTPLLETNEHYRKFSSVRGGAAGAEEEAEEVLGFDADDRARGVQRMPSYACALEDDETGGGHTQL